ncbi:O-antigen ligase family protein [Bradyrhizobium arachidis]|uniref:O-antigen ligase family protein n=1 Tax=Bradyrhizobium TaxID=374 RepID=UPI002163CE1C|nr:MULTISPECIES: O-antigen ligase family protein [Bradyrhizobium]MDN4988576.1 O-antigen ligase family protein [Bradyrhizobium sp. WYCCWR 13022]UVO35203.1 O-antigen ligase family protein [Bradyrhizobium arachidis]
MALDLLLTVGLLLSTASQLRPDGAPVGPAEICLLVWVLLTFSREIARLGPPLTPALSRLLTFWLLFAVALCIGTMTAYVLGDRHDPALFAHDIGAYLLAAALSGLMVVEPGAAARLQRIAWLSATLGAAWLIIQVAFGWGLLDPGGYDTWEWDRFRGFSDNSNQLALYCAVLVPLSLHLADSARRHGERITALICMMVAIIVGRLTKSDAFLLVLLAAGPIFGVFKLWKWLMSRERKMLLRSAFAWLLVMALPLTIAYATPLGSTLAAELEDFAKGMTKGGGGRDTDETARLRFEVWNGALRRGIDAGLLGLGPGPHLEIPQSIVAGRRDSTNAPKHEEHPKFGVIPNFEAHNTFLDLFVQGGFIAVLNFGWLLAVTLLATRRAEQDALTALVCGLAIFIGFHFDVRHPIFWFAISLCLIAPRRVPAARGG